MRRTGAFLLIALSWGPMGCSTAYRKSLGGDTAQVFVRIYRADYNTSWQSVLDSLKASRLDVSNREGGYVQTKWTENTAEKNFIDSYGTAESFLKAQYRFRVTLAKGSYNGRESVKVSVFKEQLVQRDVLEGWKPVETDGIDENTLLYRIERLIFIRGRIAEFEDARTQEAIDQSKQDF